MQSIDIRYLLEQTEEQVKIEARLKQHRSKRTELTNERRKLLALLDKNKNQIRAVDKLIVDDYDQYSLIKKTIE
jgi:hypothetical protein